MAVTTEQAERLADAIIQMVIAYQNAGVAEQVYPRHQHALARKDADATRRVCINALVEALG